MIRKRRRARDAVVVRVPETQSPSIILEGAVYTSLLWGFCGDVEVHARIITREEVRFRSGPRRR